MTKPFPLSNGTLLVAVEAAGGVYNADQLKAVAELTENHGAVAKASEDHRISLFLPESAWDEAASAMSEVGLTLRHYQDGLHQPVSCVGALCPHHSQDSLTHAMELTDAIAGMQLSAPLKIGFNGCASVCVATHTLDISVIGDVGGYRVSLGGKNSQIPEMAMFMADGVPGDKIVGLIQGVVQVYQNLAEDGESLQEVMERAGNQPFIEALAPYSQDAHSGDNPFDAFASGDSAGEEEASVDEGIDDLISDDSEQQATTEDNSMDLDELELEIEDEQKEPLSTDIDPQAGDDDASFADDVPIAQADDDGLVYEEEQLLDTDPQALADKMMAESSPELGQGETGELTEESDISEVSEEDADAFEEKIAASIEEEKAVPEMVDENIDDRLHAVAQIEHGEPDIGDEFLELDEEEFADDVRAAEAETVSEEFSEDFLDEEPIIAENEAPQQLYPKTSAGEWAFASLEPMADGRIMIRFSGGAEVVIDTRSVVGNREFRIGSAEIRITAGREGCQIDVDGVGLYLPSAAA